MLERFLEQRPAILDTLIDENVKRLNQKGKIVAGMLDSEKKDVRNLLKL